MYALDEEMPFSLPKIFDCFSDAHCGRHVRTRFAVLKWGLRMLFSATAGKSSSEYHKAPCGFGFREGCRI
jgi:hypothetical protein